MKQKDIIIFSLVTGFLYAISEIASLHGDFEIYFSGMDRYWAISGIVVTYISASSTLYFINKWNIASQKESFFSHTITYTTIAAILATIANHILTEMFYFEKSFLMLTFFWYLPYKFLESCFFELYRTRICSPNEIEPDKQTYTPNNPTTNL